MSTPKQKFRPVLTAEQIQHILALCKQHMLEPQTDSHIITMQLIGQLAPFQAKIDNRAITPAYSTTPRPTTEQALGMPTATAPTATKEEYWEACYHKSLADPTSCTIEELLAAKEHKYLHDLMTDEEKAAFEMGA